MEGFITDGFCLLGLEWGGCKSMWSGDAEWRKKDASSTSQTNHRHKTRTISRQVKRCISKSQMYWERWTSTSPDEQFLCFLIGFPKAQQRLHAVCSVKREGIDFHYVLTVPCLSIDCVGIFVQRNKKSTTEKGRIVQKEKKNEVQ